jgi:hypothetical protein
MFRPITKGADGSFPIAPDVIKGLQSQFADPDSYPVEGRGVTYTMAFFSTKHAGIGQYYLMTLKDKDGQNLAGANTYRLTVPRKAPVKQYWSATVYDRETHALIREMPRAGRSSQSPGLQTNADGSSISGSRRRRRQARTTTGCQPARPGNSRCCSASTGPTNRYSTGAGRFPTSKRSPRREESAMKPSRRETISLLAGAAPAALGMFGVAGAASPGLAQDVRPKKRTAATGEGPRRIETRIGKLEFTHDFANGYPTDATIDKLYDERDFQRACQAYLWALPAVSFRSWQRGINEQLGAKNGQVVAILSYEARRGILTANATTPYYLGFADLSAGAAGGGDAAERCARRDQRRLAERPSGDRGGRQVSRSCPGSGGLRRRQRLHHPPIADRQHLPRHPTDRRRSWAREGGALATADVSLRPAPQSAEAGRPGCGHEELEWLPPRGMDYWQRSTKWCRPSRSKRATSSFHAMLRPLGIDKGKPFKPDARQTRILTDAALVGEAMAKANSADRRFKGDKYRSDAHWDFALLLDADAPDAFWNLLDERASWFYEAVGAGAAMAPKRPGPSSAYLSAYKDKDGAWLDGGRSYRLRVPPDPPIKLFWSVTLYDVDTRALILNEQKIADRSSRMDLRKTARLGGHLLRPKSAGLASRRTGSRRCPAKTGSPISGSTSRPRPTSTGRGRCVTSSGYRAQGASCHSSTTSHGSSSF